MQNLKMLIVLSNSSINLKNNRQIVAALVDVHNKKIIKGTITTGNMYSFKGQLKSRKELLSLSFYKCDATPDVRL